MSNPMLAITAVAALLSGTPEEGRAWLDQIEERLYTWPKPGVVVRFHVKTDVLDSALAMMRQEIEARPDETTARAVQALRRVSIRGSLDTDTGKVETEIDVPFETDDPDRQAGIDKMKHGIQTMVTKAFECLPFSDASMLGKGMKVVGFESAGDAVTVTVEGSREGDRTTIHSSRKKVLPDRFERPDATMRMRYTEALPGRFAPARVEIEPRAKGPKSTADFTYLRAGNLVFPAKVLVTEGPMKATLRIESVSVHPRT